MRQPTIGLLLLLQRAHSFVVLGAACRRKILIVTPLAGVDDLGFPRKEDDRRNNKSHVPPSKGDFYPADELQNLLDFHNQIKDTTSKRSVDDSCVSPTPSLHDAVLTALQEIDNKQDDEAISLSQPIYPVTANMRKVLPNIRAIASDVDGTLLTSKHLLHPHNERAIVNAVAATSDPSSPLTHFMLATGKSRAGALDSLGPRIRDLLSKAPGVYLQGLYCVDASGTVVYEKRLESAAVEAALELATNFGSSLFCYDGDFIQASAASLQNHVVEFNARWGEPEPRRVDDNGILISYSSGYHKVLLMDDDTAKIRAIRPLLEVLAAKYDCVVTQAIDTMLELLPPNSGKAVGVHKLCQFLGIQEGELLTIGDGENDVDFLRNGAFSVAVGNAVPMAKQAADLTLVETNDEGGAAVAIEHFGLKKILEFE